MSDESSRALLGLLNQQRNTATSSSGSTGPNASTGTASNTSSGGILLNLLSAMKPAKASSENATETTPIKGSPARKSLEETKPQSMSEGLRQLLTSGIESPNVVEAKDTTTLDHKPIQLFSSIPLASSVLSSDSST